MRTILLTSLSLLLVASYTSAQEATLIVTKKAKVTQSSQSEPQAILNTEKIKVNTDDIQGTIDAMMATNQYASVEADMNIGTPGFVVEDYVIYDKLRESSNDPNQFTPNDPLFGMQEYWGVQSEQSPVNLGISRAISISNPTERVRVAFIDGGYLTEGTSTDLTPIDNISMVTVDGSNIDGIVISSTAGDTAYNAEEEIACESGHGAGVSGVSTANTDNNNQIAGIAGTGYVDTVIVQSLICGTGRLSEAADGVRWAAGGQVGSLRTIDEPVDIISISLGGKSSCPRYMQNAIDFAKSQGVIVVAAAGNENIVASDFTPANCEGVITVGGSSDITLDLASYSNYGDTVDIVARGDTILSLGNSEVPEDSVTHGVLYWSGTSFAAPQVTGMLAMAKSSSPSMTEATMLSLMQLTSTPLSGSKCDTVGCKNGLLHAERFMGAVMGLKNGNAGTISTTLKEGQLCDAQLYSMIGAVKAKLCESVTVTLSNLLSTENENISVKFLSAPLGTTFDINTASIEYEGSEFTFKSNSLNIDGRQFAYQLCIDGECNDTLLPVNIDTDSVALCQ